ncbi:MAG TPA: RagB/SusD family nutrient uptake outer membrane protein [Gemmatimonadales bacterium]
MNTLYRHKLLFGTGLLMLLGSVTYGCHDFLETKPQGTLDAATLATRAGVEGSLIATYRVLDCTNSTNSNWGCAASNWVWGSVTSDDAYKGSEATDQPGATDIELYNWTTGSAEDYLDNKWSHIYEGVVRANATLRLLRTVRTQKPGEIDDATAKSIEGEAIFLRAHYHFEGMRMWGTIPYYREDDAAFRKTNVGVNDTTEILKDLDSAFVLLPATPRGGDKGRASRWTAKAYKGKVLVYRRDWAGAVRVLDSVVASGTYALETSFDHVWTGFQQFADGPETILAYQASANDGEPNGNNANYGERLNFPHSNSPFGCCGFHQPSQNLVNFYVVNSTTGLPRAFTDPAWNTRSTVFVASTADTVDPRLDWTVGRDSVPFKDWGLHLGTWIRAPGYGGPYSPKKNIHENASGAQSKVGWAPAQLNSVHIHIYRYADLLLLLAEANVELGNLGPATTLVNLIRTRAGATAQGCGVGFTAHAESLLVAKYSGCNGDSRMAVPINDPKIQWATYRVGLYPTFPDQATARNAVRIERRLELGMEGERFFDLRRWGIATQTITDYVTIETTRRSYLNAATPFTSKYNLYPIPSLQIELSKVGSTSTLQQNPGW